MPVNPADADALARALGQDVSNATDRMLLSWTDWLTGGPTGLTDAAWEANRLTALGQLRAQLITDARLPRLTTAGSVRDSLHATAALANGTREISAAVERAASETISRLNGIWPTAIQGLTEQGGRALTDVLTHVRDGNLTRVQATVRAVDDLARAGIHGFTDAAGRRWQPAAFAEMSVRTGVTDAHTAGAIEAAGTRGTDLLMVSDAPRECPQCQPYEGKLLSLNGTTLGTQPTDADGQPATITGTLDQARANGFQHPNCRHRLYPFIPGQTRLYKATDDRENYKASQRQRALERRLRKQQAHADALHRADPRSPLTRAAKARAANTRKSIGQLLDDHPTLQRRRDRERLTLGRATRRPPPIRVRDTTLGTRLHLDPPPAETIRAPRPKPKPRLPRVDERGFPNQLTETYLRTLNGQQLDDLAEHLALRLDTGDPLDALRFDTLDDFLTYRAGYETEVDRLLASGVADDEIEASINEWNTANRPASLTHEAVGGRGRGWRANGAATRDEVKAEWQLYLENAYLDAEEATRGTMVTEAGRLRGLTPRQLMTADPRIVQANASPELLDYFETHPRLGYDTFYYRRTQNPAWAQRAARQQELNSRLRQDGGTISDRERRRRRGGTG